MKAYPKTVTVLELLHVLAEDGIHRMSLNEIMCLNSSGAYTHIHYLNGKKVEVGKNLKRFEEALAAFGFFRVHKSYIVNMHRVERYRASKSGGTVELTDGRTLPVARSRKSAFLTSFKKMATVTV